MVHKLLHIRALAHTIFKLGWPKPSLVRTWESFSPSLFASFFLSGLLMYFCFWKVLSRAFLWRSENTARRSMPLLGFPRGASGHENVPGTGTTEEEAGGTKHRESGRLIDIHTHIPAVLQLGL